MAPQQDNPNEAHSKSGFSKLHPLKKKSARNFNSWRAGYNSLKLTVQGANLSFLTRRQLKANMVEDMKLSLLALLRCFLLCEVCHTGYSNFSCNSCCGQKCGSCDVASLIYGKHQLQALVTVPASFSKLWGFLPVVLAVGFSEVGLPRLPQGHWLDTGFMASYINFTLHPH